MQQTVGWSYGLQPGWSHVWQLILHMASEPLRDSNMLVSMGNWSAMTHALACCSSMSTASAALCGQKAAVSYWAHVLLDHKDLVSATAAAHCSWFTSSAEVYAVPQTTMKIIVSRAWRRPRRARQQMMLDCTRERRHTAAKHQASRRCAGCEQ
jgi:hypothetical protein